MAGIYVHVPFCKQKCTYCDFVSFPNREGEIEPYFTDLCHEIVFRAPEGKGMEFDTVYFGGGTPSFVPAVFVTAALTLVKRYYRVKENAEITIEMNPGTVTAEKLAAYKRAGFNRFSVGFQTADDRELARLNRIHTKADFIAATELLAGENFSADVMIGLHDQKKEDVIESLRVALNHGASHISMYALTPEDGTPVYTDYLNGELPCADEVRALYDAGVSYLESRGFHRYEVSNFALPGWESRHNLNYWRRGEYLGFGIAAHSFLRNRRYSNTENPAEYRLALKNERLPVVFSEELTKEEAEEELLMLAFRLKEGLDLATYKAATGKDFLTAYAEKLKRYAGCLEISETRVSVKDEYLYVQDEIVSGLLA